MKDSINSTYMGQKRIAQTIPCMSTSNKPSYVSYFQICRHLHRISMVTIQLKCDFNSHFSSKLNLLYEQREETDLTLWLVKLAKPVKSLIWNIHTCLIWFNGTEREVLSWDCELCYYVEESWFANIRQPNLQKHQSRRCMRPHLRAYIVIVSGTNRNKSSLLI